MAELRSILTLRAPLYAEAAETIDTSSVRVAEAARMISTTLRQKDEQVTRKK